jgi:hypothetical protein
VFEFVDVVMLDVVALQPCKRGLHDCRPQTRPSLQNPTTRIALPLPISQGFAASVIEPFAMPINRIAGSYR